MCEYQIDKRGSEILEHHHRVVACLVKVQVYTFVCLGYSLIISIFLYKERLKPTRCKENVQLDQVEYDCLNDLC